MVGGSLRSPLLKLGTVIAYTHKLGTIFAKQN